jgi:hypothetical protein
MLPKRGGSFFCTNCGYPNSPPWYQVLAALLVAGLVGYATWRAFVLFSQAPEQPWAAFGSVAMAYLAFGFANLLWFHFADKPFASAKFARPTKRSLLWSVLVYVLLPFSLVIGAFFVAISVGAR